MSGLIPESFVEELLGRIDIVELIERHVQLKRSGREYHACCPFHDEKTPSFTVSPQKQFYHCFGCGAHGSAIGFMMNYEGLEFVDAVEEAKAIYEKPTVIIAHTIPGKGIPEIEFDFKWHGVPPKPEEGEKFLKELRTLGGKIKSEHE